MSLVLSLPNSLFGMVQRAIERGYQAADRSLSTPGPPQRASVVSRRLASIVESIRRCRESKDYRKTTPESRHCGFRKAPKYTYGAPPPEEPGNRRPGGSELRGSRSNPTGREDASFEAQSGRLEEIPFLGPLNVLLSRYSVSLCRWPETRLDREGHHETPGVCSQMGIREGVVSLGLDVQWSI